MTQNIKFRNVIAFYLLATAPLLAVNAGAEPVAPSIEQKAAPNEPSLPLFDSEIISVPEKYEVSIGMQEAPVTVVEYSALTCGHCAEFHTDMWPLIKKKYVDTGKVRWVFRSYFLDGIALQAAMLLFNAPKEQWYSLLNTFFTKQKEWLSNDGYTKLAQIADTDSAGFDKVLKNEVLSEELLKQHLKAKNKLNVSATPTFYVNNQVVEGVIELSEFEKMIDEQVSKASKT
jgi:protein-disulfide isomerase